MAVKPPIQREQIPSNKYGNGRAYKISQISEHHVVGDAKHVIAKAQGPAIFSTTFTIAMDGTIYQLVDEANTPYCDNDYRSNGRSITIEHAGGAPGYPYTEAMYRSSIALHAYLFEKYGPLNCVRHRDIPEIKADPSKATACPGGLDVERIIREAKQGGGIVMSPDQISDWVSKEHFIGYGKPASDATFKSWGDLLRNNPIDGALTILTAVDGDPNALKNKPAETPGEYVPYTLPPLFTKK